MFAANLRHLSAVIASESGIESAEAASWREVPLSDQDLASIAGGITRGSGEEIPQ